MVHVLDYKRIIVVDIQQALAVIYRYYELLVMQH